MMRPSTMTDLLTLADRVESAEGPDRAIPRPIAAAPELLDALRGLVDRPIEFDGGKIVIDDGAHNAALNRIRIARAAIAKATGAA